MCYKTDKCGLKEEKKGRAHWSVSTITGQNKMEGNQLKMPGSVEELDICICVCFQTAVMQEKVKVTLKNEKEKSRHGSNSSIHLSLFSR